MSTPGGPLAVEERQLLTDLVGQPAAMVLWYVDFTAAAPVADLQAVLSTGGAGIVTWEPWRAGGDDSEGDPLSMRAIVAGAHDDYLYRWANDLKAWGSTLYLRLAHEFNGSWYPWTPAGGLGPADYVAAWRHVHNIFADECADNVKWVWSPAVLAPGSGALADWYPGEDYLDVLAVDGYNWGTSRPWSHWTSPEDLFGETFAALRALGPDKPILVAEVGCAEDGGSKPLWIRQLVDYLTAQSDIVGFVWFEHNKELDWRIASTPESAAAMAEALA